jgi:hypothetical protein
MNGPQTNSDSTWVIQAKSSDEHVADANHDYHWLIERDGYVLNRGSMAFVNVINNPDYPVRGHGSDYFENRLPAQRGTNAQMAFQFMNVSLVSGSEAHAKEEEEESIEEDEKLQKVIATFPKSHEKRVISFGLYGRNPKYTHGALQNTELALIYFPGWVLRFYVTSDVPKEVLEGLQKRGAEIFNIPDGVGYAAGMFYRFLVAADSSVDRYLIRDADSRLNARDAISVEEWILSQAPVHIQRDHVNHCIPMNGGMWGGTVGAIKDMSTMIENWIDKDSYGADLHFLEESIYPAIRDFSLQHDAYCCDRFPNSKPWPSKRYANYQHVGQVFDADDKSRLTDIDGFIRGVPVPGQCRKRAEWIYG